MDPEPRDNSNRRTARVSTSRQIIEKSVIQSAIIWIALNLHYTFFEQDGSGSRVPLALMLLVFNWLWNFLYEKFRGV